MCVTLNLDGKRYWIEKNKEVYEFSRKTRIPSSSFLFFIFMHVDMSKGFRAHG
jgi:alpha-acetolactate decarboxylase